jgi:N-acetylglucosamine-6-phosphate deacetylase
MDICPALSTCVHGAGGIDIMQGGDAARQVARLHARHGTTTLLGTTMTAPPQDIERALQGWAAPSPNRIRTARKCWACIWKARS